MEFVNRYRIGIYVAGASYLTAVYLMGATKSITSGLFVAMGITAVTGFLAQAVDFVVWLLVGALIQKFTERRK